MTDAEACLLQPMDLRDGTDPSHRNKTPLRPGELPSEAKCRLQTLVDTRKKLEEAFPQRKKDVPSFDVTKFLTEATVSPLTLIHVGLQIMKSSAYLVGARRL